MIACLGGNLIAIAQLGSCEFSPRDDLLLISVLKWGIGLIVYLYLPSKHMGVFEPW